MKPKSSTSQTRTIDADLVPKPIVLFLGVQYLSDRTDKTLLIGKTARLYLRNILTYSKQRHGEVCYLPSKGKRGGGSQYLGGSCPSPTPQPLFPILYFNHFLSFSLHQLQNKTVKTITTQSKTKLNKI
jgi:hypothetical protein